MLVETVSKHFLKVSLLLSFIEVTQVFSCHQRPVVAVGPKPERNRAFVHQLRSEKLDSLPEVLPSQRVRIRLDHVIVKRFHLLLIVSL